MKRTLSRKIIDAHLVKGDMTPGQRIALSVDQVLTQDATGTMVYLQFEMLGFPRVKPAVVVSYVDHNTLQTGPENAEDHRYLQTTAAKYGAYFSRPGGGICHQVHLERFAVPGQTLIGSDSHTPNAGAVGMLACGSGGLEVAVAMGGSPYHVPAPRVLGVSLSGRLGPWVHAKDAMLELLRRLSVKGGVGKVVEFFGPGLSGLSVSERAAICNLGVELGATSIIFPADERTREFLKAQGRESAYAPLAADDGAPYDELIELDLGSLEPMIACPSSPDAVVPVREVAGRPVRQVCIGSCNNSSVEDLTAVAAIFDGRTVHPDVSMSVSPGSRQVMAMLERSGAMASLVGAGARILESACGPCIGMGFAPARGAISVRTMNRNFPGRSGTTGDLVYLTTPYVAAACALTGRITPPSELGIKPPAAKPPSVYEIADTMIIPPPADGSSVEVERGANIAPMGPQGPLADDLSGEVLLNLGDNVSTDAILPAGAKVLPFRSNIPKISEFAFGRIDENFHLRAKSKGGGLVVGGQNYGQGSSREHAAIAMRFLGIRAVLARSFARIHRANLIDQGVLPVALDDAAFLEALAMGSIVRIAGARAAVEGKTPLTIAAESVGSRSISLSMDEDEREILLCGGLINYTRARQ